MDLEYFHLFDYNDTNQAKVAAKDFEDKFISSFARFLKKRHFKDHDTIEITESIPDIVDALHMAKHSVQYFSQLFQVQPNPIHKYDKDGLHKDFIGQHEELSRGGECASAYGLIGNIGSCSGYKLAATYAYWISKLKPLLRLKVTPEPIDSEHKDFFDIHLNEYFALYLAFGFSTKNYKGVIQDVDWHHAEEFVRMLRYKDTSVESLSIFFEIWISNLIK
jgi:hypothetical protein